jgi:predicted NUDIX family NTP pyrophosphohydrolase
MTNQKIDQNFEIIDHHIKRGIIKHLLTVPSARYSELRPKNVESNLFMYHLQQLIKQGYVEKVDKSYQLTQLGKQMADRVSLDSLKFRIQPKLITILTIQRADGKWLLIERTHQPFLGYKGFPSGKIHYGEDLHTAAQRELEEKTGLTNVELTLRGNFIMRYSRDGQTVNHINGYVFSGQCPDGIDTNVRTDMFYSLWGDESGLFAERSFNGHKQILKLLQEYKPGDLFISENDFVSDF